MVISGKGGGTTVQVKCLLRNGVLPLLLASAWVHCTHIVVQRGERAEFMSCSRVTAGTEKPKTFATLSLGSLSRETSREYIQRSRRRARYPLSLGTEPHEW